MTSKSQVNTGLWVIYGLRLVGDPEYRYIGLTTIGPSKRLERHKINSKIGVKSRVYSWIRSVGADNIVSDVLEVCPDGDGDYLRDAEIFWIMQIRSFGHRLKNHTDGGGGTAGATWSLPEETKRKQGLAKIGNLNPQYGKPSWNSGMTMPEEWLEKRSNAQKKLWQDPEYSARMRKTNGDAARLVCHNRWHVARSIVKDGCIHCA